MAGIDPDFPVAHDDDEPPRAVVGAPEPGQKKDYSRVGASQPLDPDFPIADPVADAMPEPPPPPNPDDMGANVALANHVIKSLPIVGQPVMNALNWGRRNFFHPGETREDTARLMAATEKAHPTAAATGDVLGPVLGLAAASLAAPAAFGASALTYGAGITTSALTNMAIKATDNYIRSPSWDPTESFDPVDIGITGVASAAGGAISTWLNRAFTVAVNPQVKELAEWGLSKGIPIQAGHLVENANPLIKKVPGELYAAGEKLFPAGEKAVASEAKSLAAWHKGIAETIGSDAPRVTSKVMGETRKEIIAEAKRLAAAKTANGGVFKPDDLAAAKKLVERDQAVRLMEGVMKINPNGEFTPQEFYEAIQEGVDKTAKTQADEFAYDGGGELAKFAKYGGMLLKTASAPAIDQHLGVAMLKKAMWSIATGAAPAAVHHFLGGGVTPTGIIGGAVALATAGAKFLTGRAAGVAARSPNVANLLLGKSAPLYLHAGRMLIKPGRGLAKMVTPGLAQQATPGFENFLTSQSVP